MRKGGSGQTLAGMALVAVLLMATGCAVKPPARDGATTDTGRPLTDGLKAYDVLHYTLRHEIFPESKSIRGAATIRLRATTSTDIIELDFDGHYDIAGIVDCDGALTWRQEPAKLFVILRKPLSRKETLEFTVNYSGKPIEAERAPWDGGFVWSTTPSGKPWIATAMQGEGCDIWWPCKDHPSGEPLEGLDMHFTVPAGLTATANGVLVDVGELDDGRRSFHWQTKVPTNTYGVALNVAPYVLIEDSFTSINGTVVPLKFWAIEDHEEDARKLFDEEFKRVIEFFERKVGPYPWGQEKLGITETPHLGMEHQTINAYGNEYRRGDYGFDWLFHHELAHEWFGNVMTHQTVSDMWLHEGFGAFMQPEYTREILGEVAFHASMYKAYLGIHSCNAIAPRDEFSGDELYFDDPEGKGPAGDIYSKGVWLLHTLRNLIGDEPFWRAVRRLVYDTTDPATLGPTIPARFRSTDDFLAIVNEEAGRDLSWFFEVYARRGPLPVLDVREEGDDLVLEWQAPDDLPFAMPIPVRVKGEIRMVHFEDNLGRLDGVSERDVLVDPYMTVLRKLPVVPTCEERRAEEKKSPH